VAVSDAGRVRSSIRSVLSGVGIDFESTADSYVIDLSDLDHQLLVGKRQAALQTTASLLFRVGHDIPIVARLPEEKRSRRALAASGLMFALVQHQAHFDEPTHSEDESESLFPSAGLQRLETYDSWRHTFTPFDVELREFMLGVSAPESETAKRAQSSASRGLGTYDTDFAAFVNPHELPLGTELAAISELAAPWFRRLLSTGRVDAASDVRSALALLGHALDNVREHAFRDLTGARSLVTLGLVESGDQRLCRMQILDNGVGIPASLAPQLGAEAIPINRRSAEELLSLAIHGRRDGYDPLLRWGRGQGLPEMRRLTGKLGGRLTISTSGPGDSMIAIDCDGDQPSEPYSDLVPVTGTIVTLWVPLSRQVVSDTSRPLQEELAL
jgi:hypothetical protein